MANGFLSIRGREIVDGLGKPVLLYGAALGGWMNMENFITGYAGHESEHRAAMRAVLGSEKYDFFIDRFLTYFFMEEDARFFKSLGLNCLRLPFNYRHFEDDTNPRVLKEEGFKHLDRVVELCAKHGIYTILDMHTVPGGQNPDWHSDNPTNYAAFWEYKDHQDRTIWLWQQIAERYRNNPWVAGYNPLNEPCDPQHVRLPAFYARLAAALRPIDPQHILWLDGNTFAMEWVGFEFLLPNAAYAIHDYAAMGFPGGERYAGTPEQDARLEAQFLRKLAFHATHAAVPWNGEFGPVYAEPALDPDAQTTNAQRYALLAAQLAIYRRHHTSWSLWLYKDIGLQGMLHTSPASLWNTTIAPARATAQRLQLNAWGRQPSPEVAAVFDPLVRWIDDVCPAATRTYPTSWSTERHLHRAVLQTFLAAAVQADFAELFRDFTHEMLDEAAMSFRFDRCVQRDGLNRILTRFAGQDGE